MMKMLIKLDEAKIRREGIYNVEKLWQIIDGYFNRYGCIKEIQEDKAVMYSGNPNSNNLMSDFTFAYIHLSEKKWFAEYCCKWIWLDNEDDENLPMQEIDVLSKERKRNPLFN